MTTHTIYRTQTQSGIESIVSSVEHRPKPLPHEILVRIHAVALNNRDLAIVQGVYPFPVKGNLVICSDAAGDIVEIGSQVPHDWKIGDKVIAYFGNSLYGPQQDWAHGLGGPVDGVLCEFKVFDPHFLVKSPAHLSYVEAATLGLAGTTSWNALYGIVPLLPGQTVLFLGTGGVSMQGLMIACTAGATTIITSSSDEKLAKAKGFGANYTINYKTQPDWEDEVLRITNGRGADHIFENGGAGTIERSLQCVKMGGVVSVIGFMASVSKLPDVAGLVLVKGAIIRGINAGSKQLFEDFVRFVDARKLRPYIDKVFGFDKSSVLSAFSHLQSQTFVGKIVIRVA